MAAVPQQQPPLARQQHAELREPPRRPELRRRAGAGVPGGKNGFDRRTLERGILGAPGRLGGIDEPGMVRGAVLAP